MNDLPWSHNRDLNILEPCMLCREQRISVGDGYCREHLIERLTQVILEQKV